MRLAYEASTGFDGLIKFSSRQMQYIVSDSNAGGSSGGVSVVVAEDACEHEDRQEDLQELEYGENEESESEKNEDDNEFDDGQGSEYQDLDQTIPYQGEAFSQSRAPRLPQSDSGKTTSTSPSASKRRRSADRSTASKSSSTPTISSVRQKPPASLSSSHHHLDQQLGRLLSIANPAKLVTLKAGGTVDCSCFVFLLHLLSMIILFINVAYSTIKTTQTSSLVDARTTKK